MMKTLIALAIISAAIFVLLALLKRKGAAGEWPLHAKRPLSEREQQLYWKLLKALPDHVVLAQVALSQILVVKKGVEKAQMLRNRFDRKVADFVVCGKDFSVIAVIELDDSTHNRASARQRDDVKDMALQAAGLRVIRWPAKSLPDGDQILADLFPPAAMAGAQLASVES